jgi:hypothetical protein
MEVLSHLRFFRSTSVIAMAGSDGDVDCPFNGMIFESLTIDLWNVKSRQ